MMKREEIVVGGVYLDNKGNKYEVIQKNRQDKTIFYVLIGDMFKSQLYDNIHTNSFSSFARMVKERVE